jgi:hypothetical protein
VLFFHNKLLDEVKDEWGLRLFERALRWKDKQFVSDKSLQAEEFRCID